MNICVNIGVIYIYIYLLHTYFKLFYFILALCSVLCFCCVSSASLIERQNNTEDSYSFIYYVLSFSIET